MPGDDPSPMFDIDLALADSAWTEAPGDLPALARRIAAGTLASLRARGRLGEGPGEVSLRLTGDAELSALNAAYRGKQGPTNVLSFPGREGGMTGQLRHLGDVAIAYETVAGEAEAQGKTLGDHLAHLVVHGLLHLAGYDHQTTEEADEMEALEREILSGFAIADPYEERPAVVPVAERAHV